MKAIGGANRLSLGRFLRGVALLSERETARRLKISLNQLRYWPRKPAFVVLRNAVFFLERSVEDFCQRRQGAE
jgi:hypothetical protein